VRPAGTAFALKGGAAAVALTASQANTGAAGAELSIPWGKARSESALSFRGGFAWTVALATASLAWFAAVYYFRLWWVLGVSEMPLSFSDWHAVVAASDCADLGYNVYRRNPCDVSGLIHEYGAIWLKLGRLGLTRENYWGIGLSISTSFLVSAALVLRPKTGGQFALCLAAVCSPAVMLGVERANVDLLIFTLLLPMTLLLCRSERSARMVAMALLFLLTVLKLYPAVAAASVFWTSARRRSIFASIGLFVLTVATWVVLDRDNLALVLRVFERPDVLLPAFGSRLLFDALRSLHLWPLTFLSSIWAGTIAFVLVLLVSWHCAYRIQRYQPLNTAECRSEFVRFVAGTAIFVFAFAVTANYDYRCIFVLFSIPLLLRYLEHTPQSRNWERRIAATALGVMVVALWINGLMALIFFTARLAVPSQMSVMLIAGKHLVTWVLISLLIMLGSTIFFGRLKELAQASAESRGGTTGSAQP
jgi:hypothetical protein